MKPALFSAPLDINLTDSVLNTKRRLEEQLLTGMDEYVVWQEEAKKALVKVIIEWLYNVYREQGVLWAVFLGGPTGVGKTELARSICRTLLGNPAALTKIVSETMPHPADISQIVGSSAGYIGYGDAPEMADTKVHAGYKIAKEKWTLHPVLQGYEAENFSIVLVDEIEKAHPDIANAFLGCIQTGEMKIASGKESDSKLKHSKYTDTRNTLFIFTSNVGEHTIATSKTRSIGFTPSTSSDGENEVFLQELKRRFKPEFIWRMDACVRCHSLDEDQLRQVFELHTARMNKILDEKNYFASFQVATTRGYVDKVMFWAGSIEYWARAIAPAIKEMGALAGLAIQSGKIPKNANWILELDYDSEKWVPLLNFINGPLLSQSESLRSVSVSRVSVSEHTRNLVEGKINRYGDGVRATVQEYINLIAWYDSWFADICRILEKRLRGFWFNTNDISELRATAYISIHQWVQQPASYEILVGSENMFWEIGFRPIEKYLRSAIVRSFSLTKIYQTIYVLLKRPLTREESILISQHIHRLLQWKKSV